MFDNYFLASARATAYENFFCCSDEIPSPQYLEELVAAVVFIADLRDITGEFFYFYTVV